MSDMDVKQIRKEIKFPYKKKYIMHSIDTLFKNLVAFNPILQKTNQYKIMNSEYLKNGDLIDSKYDDGYYQFINDDDENYESVNILSDYFSEKCRIKCKRYDMKYSPYDTFNNDEELQQLVNELKMQQKEVNWKNLRELLYKKGECANFKLTLAKSIYIQFNAKRILDFSAGWGDRLIAAIAADQSLNIDYYDWSIQHFV